YLTEGLNGYDTHRMYSSDGKQIAWLSMKTDGYEADKNDIILLDPSSGKRINLTEAWEGTVNSFVCCKDGSKVYFTTPTRGTVQLFAVHLSRRKKVVSHVQQISDGAFDIGAIVGETEEGLVVTSTTMTRAAEVYLYHLKKRSLAAITHVNDAI